MNNDKKKYSEYYLEFPDILEVIKWRCTRNFICTISKIKDIYLMLYLFINYKNYIIENPLEKEDMIKFKFTYLLFY